MIPRTIFIRSPREDIFLCSGLKMSYSDFQSLYPLWKYALGCSDFPFFHISGNVSLSLFSLGPRN